MLALAVELQISSVIALPYTNSELYPASDGPHDPFLR